ncbi:MAG: sulfite exporter TauE/SafE family protein [Gammaproteobacteria bacterium]|nr:sulfite exporter TauE/SafE family protein [Gammaproteobacteria bacterium]MDH5321710.1 sulfite exporter TauE/SafE family protein [Gammaproteobacteria bacterium]
MIFGLEFLTLALLVAAAFLTGVLHGATGMAGGIVMASILAHFVGIKVAVPVMTVALIFSHLSRILMYAKETDWSIAGRVLLFGCPTIVLGALVFGRISATTVAIVFAAFLCISFPVKYWARHYQLTTGPKLLAGASMIWGMLAGNVIGPGFFLAPFLLGTGMNRLTFVGTLATVTLVMNVLKLGVFGATDLMHQETFALGTIIGILSMPGNWVGRHILQRVRDSDHRLAIDLMTLMLIANFIYLATRTA